jgi:hypothetical protein
VEEAGVVFTVSGLLRAKGLCCTDISSSRMLIFVQQLLYFCTSEVIEPNWRAFMSRLHASEDKPDGSPEDEATPGAPKRTVDELMQDHVDFLATCLKECTQKYVDNTKKYFQ